MEPYRIIAPLNTRLLSKTWTQAEIQSVMNQARNKKSPDEIARKLNRSVADIKSKLKAIAADMYLKKLPYEQIQEATGVDKDTFILTSSRFKHESIIQKTDNHTIVDVSIYEFPVESEENVQMINVDIRDGIDEMIVIVSVDNPFSMKTLCEHISTPIMNTFSTCSRFAKKISNSIS